MVIKVEQSLVNQLRSNDPSVLAGVLSSIDKQLVTQLKQSKEDLRYVQGYSAAIDFLSSLILKQ